MNNERQNLTKKESPTEGESIIEQFFKDKMIKYIMYPYVNKKARLTDDKRSYREADFYLPKYKMYVEFLGKWNSGISPEGLNYREEYKEKMRVYKANGIPCIYLWPDNLGFLEQAINMRIEAELKEKGMRKELIRFKYDKVDKSIEGDFMLFVALIFFLLLWAMKDDKSQTAINQTTYLLGVLWLICLGAFISLVNGAIKYVKIFFGKD